MTLEPVNEVTNTPDVVEETEHDTHNPVEKTIVNDAPVGATVAEETAVSKSTLPAAPVGANAASPVALLTAEESQRFRTLWNEVQGQFVDEPRAAVQQADALVSEVIKQITQMFADEHTSLEGQWKEGKEVSTEDLRQALLRYHSFFKRLVV